MLKWVTIGIQDVLVLLILRRVYRIPACILLLVLGGGQLLLLVLHHDVLLHFTLSA